MDIFITLFVLDGQYFTPAAQSASFSENPSIDFYTEIFKDKKHIRFPDLN